MPRKKPIRFLLRCLRLWASRAPAVSSVRSSYDDIAGGYDDAWTNHMRDRSREMVDRLDVRPGSRVLDLACGTGFVTGLLAERAGDEGRVTGIDFSAGMLAVARNSLPGNVSLIEGDALEAARSLPSRSFDAITCAWALGYSRPLALLKQIRRLLGPAGRVGLIDNTLFTLSNVTAASLLVFMERPERLRELIRVRFLLGERHLRLWMRLAGLRADASWSGRKSYTVANGGEAIASLVATGAAAGFERAVASQDREAVFSRFARVLEDRYRRDGVIEITHRYAAAVGGRP